MKILNMKSVFSKRLRSAGSYVILSLGLLGGVAAQAVDSELAPGTYTVFDQFGYPVIPNSNDPSIKILDAHLAKARKGGSLVLSSTEPMDSVFPAFLKGGVQQRIMDFPEYLFENLMQADPRGEARTLHAHLAESVTIEKDLQTVVFKLRDGVRFSDGTFLEAEDVIRSWEFFKDVVYGPALSTMIERMYGRPHLRIVDKLKVAVTFTDIDPINRRSAIFNFAQLSIVRAKSGKFEIPSDYIGTGAYEVISASRERVRMKRRPDYWANFMPYYNFDEIRVESFFNPMVAREALKGKLINFLGDSHFNGVRALEEAADQSYFTFLKASRHDSGDSESRTTALVLNTSKPPLDDLRVRQAIALAFDLTTSLKDIYGGRYSSVVSLGSESIFRPSGPPSPEVLSSMNDFRFSIEAAKPFETSGLQAINGLKDRTARLKLAASLLREAGIQFQKGRAVKDGRPLNFEVISSPDHERVPQLVQLQKTLGLLGIELTIRQFGDHGSYVKSLKENSYDLATVRIPWPRQYSALDPDILYMWFAAANATRSSAGIKLNSSNIESPAVDRIIEELRTVTPESPRFKVLNEALIRLMSVAVAHLPMGDADYETVFYDRQMCVAPRRLMARISAYVCN